MKAIVYTKSIPRYAVMKLLGAKRAARLAPRPGFCPASLQDIAEKPLPTREWVRVKPTMSGVCGSDLSVVCAKGSPYFSPLTSTPFVLGHELVGTIVEIGDDVRACESAESLSSLSVGDRVILEPALGCRVRGIDPPCTPCARGQSALCENVTRGDISAGIQTGYCRDTGGGWSENFVAHRTQLYQVPDGVSDRAAVLAEPLACALHGARRAPLTDDQSVLIVGCGSIGLLTIAALRGSGFRGRIVGTARYPHQRQHALNLGADEIIQLPKGASTKERYAAWARSLEADLYFPELGKPTVLGGADATFDCIGSSQSIDDAIRFTAAGGNMVLVGMPGIPYNVDWTAIWYKELSVHAAYAYGMEHADGTPVAGGRPRHTCEMALELLKNRGDRLERLVGEPFALSDFREALRTALFTGRSGAVKTVFQIE